MANSHTDNCGGNSTKESEIKVVRAGNWTRYPSFQYPGFTFCYNHVTTESVWYHTANKTVYKRHELDNIQQDMREPLCEDLTEPSQCQSPLTTMDIDMVMETDNRSVHFEPKGGLHVGRSMMNVARSMYSNWQTLFGKMFSNKSRGLSIAEIRELEIMNSGRAEPSDGRWRDRLKFPNPFKSKTNLNKAVDASQAQSMIVKAPETVAKRQRIAKPKCWFPNHCYFVLDIPQIRDRNFVQLLLQLKMKQTEGSIIYVPHCVRKQLEMLAGQCCEPDESSYLLEFIYQLFCNRVDVPSIQMQSAEEDQLEPFLPLEHVKDRIINACLQASQHVPFVVLISDDEYLNQKAVAHNVAITKRATLMATAQMK